MDVPVILRKGLQQFTGDGPLFLHGKIRLIYGNTLWPSSELERGFRTGFYHLRQP